MSETVLDNLSFQVDRAALLRKLCLLEHDSHAPEVLSMAGQAETVARPKAVYRVAFIEQKAADHVVVEGIRFSSRVLRVNLDQAHRVFAYVATCGTELEAWYRSQKDLLRQFWAETVAEMALQGAMRALCSHLLARFRLQKVSAMAPGSLTDWPLEQQRQLFSLLGDVQESIGVRLTEALLMVPTKSVSGLFFPSETAFESCQLCSRERCPGRRAPYDSGLYARKYRLAAEADGTS
jgi:hypothetical protein